MTAAMLAAVLTPLLLGAISVLLGAAAARRALRSIGR